MKEAYFYSLGSAHCQHRESQDLLKLLSEKDIAVIPLKGTFLSKRIYGCIESRGTNIDVDIFIKWNDREKLHNVLTENGYVFSPSEETKDWLWQENCTSPGSQLIDVLYDIWLRGTCKEAIAGLWAGARRVTDGDGLKYYRFGQEELLIYMSQCLVTSDDGYKCLKYICDVNEFLNLHSRELDWESVIEKVKKWHLRRSLYTALSLAGNLYDNDLPPSVMNSTKPGLFKRIFIKTFFNRKVILKENFRRRFMDKFLSYTFFELIEASSAAEYWRVVKRTLLPPKEVMLSNKNYSSKPLYAEYALRLFRSFSRLFYDGQV
ncbi:MAG: nucleotidyltransferase family protein [Candidatus Omnitrophica bacterium]|nr:nucleotidyltransferase family protein [Candidatus Omnitrophota bacterium]